MIYPHHLDLPQPSMAISYEASSLDITLCNNDHFSFKKMIQQNTTLITKEILTKILEQTGGNKAQAARILQIDYKTIHTKIKQLGISIPGGRHAHQEKRKMET